MLFMHPEKVFAGWTGHFVGFGIDLSVAEGNVYSLNFNPISQN